LFDLGLSCFHISASVQTILLIINFKLFMTWKSWNICSCNWLITTLFSVKACQDCWEYIKKKYVRERRQIKNVPSGSGATKVQWVLFKKLGFMDRVLQSRM